MTDIQKVRALCQDIPLFYRQDLIVAGEGTDNQKVYQLQYFPLLDGSVAVYDSTGATVSASGYTIDYEAGTITFATQPDAETFWVTYKHTLLTDEHIQTFLEMEGGVKLAAAQALLSIATSQALIQKKIKSLDLQTDGPALAQALKDLSKELRSQATGEESESAWDIAEQVHDIFGAREKICKDIMRES